MEWRPAGWSLCLALLISPCTIKSRSSLLALAHPGGPGKRAIKRLWCGGGTYNAAQKSKVICFGFLNKEVQESAANEKVLVL